ncbi:MAG TPA: thiamine pyrophosphate-dependent enzyme, partial [Gemmatimonadales bacterium]
TGAPETGRRFALQSLDQRAMAGPVAKAVIRLGGGMAMADDVARAHALALAEEPGPVVLELGGGEAGEGRGEGRGQVPSPPSRLPALHELVTLVKAARRPVIYAGQGCAGGAASLRRLAEQLGAPVATTLSGRGVIPEDHPLALAIDLSPAGVDALNRLLATADLILVLGCKLSHNGSAGFRLVLPPDRLVHVDASAEVLGANYPARLTLQADVPGLLVQLAAEPWTSGAWRADEIDACRRAARPDDRAEPRIHGVEPPTPEVFFAALRAELPPEAILTLDSGQHQMLARRHYRVLSPRGMIAPSDFQSMGFGLPAAIGAALAAPERPVVALIGDGGFAMSGLELLTAVRNRLPVITIVFRDGMLGLIREQQMREFGHAHGVDLPPVDLAAFAAAVGIRYVGMDGDLRTELQTALSAREPALVDVRVGDSPAMRRQHATGFARASVRRALGPRLIGVLKRWLR